MKLPNFDSWSNGELSKNGHHFRKLSYQKMSIPKMCSKLVLQGKKIRKIHMIFYLEN